MSEEIKETLDWTLEYLEGIDKTRNTKILTTNEANILLDYITNLQQKVEQLENIRKEAIEYMKEFIFEPLLINEDRKLIMCNENLKNFENILNKGDNNGK